MHNLGNTVASSDSQDAHAMLHRLNILSCKQTVFVLVAHVLYLDVMQRAPLLRLVQRLTRMLRMDMYLDNILYHCHNHRIAHILQRLADRLFINISILNNELRAIRIFQINRFNRLHLCRSTRRYLQHLAILTTQACQTALEENDKSLTAGINNASCF